MISYEIIRSRRRTLALQVEKDGKVLVRAPFRYPTAEIGKFVERHKAWIEKKLAEVEKRQSSLPVLSTEEEQA